MHPISSFATWKGIAALSVVLAVLGGGCDTGVSPDPTPGVFRLVIQADAADSTVTIGASQFRLSDENTRAVMQLNVSQARVYRDTNYFELVRDLQTVVPQPPSVNVLEKGQGGDFKTFTLFETFLGPGTYDSLRFAVEAREFRVRSRENPGGFKFSSEEGDLQLAPGLDLAYTLPQDEADAFAFPFEITAADTTIMRLEIEPLRSLTRVVDSYYFAPQIQVADVTRRSGP